MIRPMVSEFIFTPIPPAMKVSGQMIYKMALDLKSGQMDLDMMENILKERSMEMGKLNSQMAHNM